MKNKLWTAKIIFQTLLVLAVVSSVIFDAFLFRGQSNEGMAGLADMMVIIPEALCIIVLAFVTAVIVAVQKRLPKNSSLADQPTQKHKYMIVSIIISLLALFILFQLFVAYDSSKIFNPNDPNQNIIVRHPKIVK